MNKQFGSIPGNAIRSRTASFAGAGKGWCLALGLGMLAGLPGLAAAQTGEEMPAAPANMSAAPMPGHETTPEAMPAPAEESASEAAPAPASTPASAPAAESAPEPAMARGSVQRSAFTTAVVDREPSNNLHKIANDVHKVYYFTALSGLAGQTVTHRWEYDGKTMAEVHFKVRGQRWRVWSSKNLEPGWTGSWKVSVLNGSGQVIAEDEFDYVAAPKPASMPAPEPAPMPAPAPAEEAAPAPMPQHESMPAPAMPEQGMPADAPHNASE